MLGRRLSEQCRDTFPYRFVCNDVVTIIVRGSLSSNNCEVFQTALWTILHRDLQCTKGTRNFSSAERRLKTDRCGQPVTVATEQNVVAMECLIKEDPRITENEIKDSFNLSSGSLNRILRHHLGVWKRCARWVPHRLTEEQGRGRVEWRRNVLRKFNGGGSGRVWEIVTGNEIFVFQCDTETKYQSSIWLFPGGSPPAKFNTSRNSFKQMIAVLVAKSSYVASFPLSERKTVNTE